MGYNRIQQPQLFTHCWDAHPLDPHIAPLRLPGFPTNRYVVSWWPLSVFLTHRQSRCIDAGAKIAENARKNARIRSVWTCVFPVIETLHIFAMSVSWKPCRTIPRDVQKDCPASKVLLKVSTAEKSRLTGQGLAKTSFSGNAVSVSKHIPTSL